MRPSKADMITRLAMSLDLMVIENIFSLTLQIIHRTAYHALYNQTRNNEKSFPISTGFGM